MMNPIGIGNEDRISSRDSSVGRGPHDGGPGSGARWGGSGRYVGSEVEMAGMAERWWKELRPSSAGRFRLDVAIRQDRERSERHPHRPRQHLRPRLRSASR
jgi:hypothetical protein